MVRVFAVWLPIERMRRKLGPVLRMNDMVRIVTGILTRTENGLILCGNKLDWIDHRLKFGTLFNFVVRFVVPFPLIH